MAENGTQSTLEAVLKEQDIRGVTYPSPTGPIEGYQWRLLLVYPGTANSPQRSEWTTWVFASQFDVDQMLNQWHNYLATRGHRAKNRIPPGTSTH